MPWISNRGANLSSYGPNLILLVSTLVVGRLPTEYSTEASIAIGLFVAAFVLITGRYSDTADDKSESLQLARHKTSEAAAANDYALFENLASNWRGERGSASSVDKIVMCYSYQRIIAMGDRAIPLILRRLETEGNEPDHWFWALRVLTGENPIEDDKRGDLQAMSRRWLEWGRTHYVW